MATKESLDVTFPLRKRYLSGLMVGTIGWNWMGVDVGVGRMGVVMLDTPTGVVCAGSTADVVLALRMSVEDTVCEVLSVSENGGTTVVLGLTTADVETVSGRLRTVDLASEDGCTVWRKLEVPWSTTDGMSDDDNWMLSDGNATVAVGRTSDPTCVLVTFPISV